MFTHLIRHRMRHLIRHLICICCLRVYNLLIYNPQVCMFTHLIRHRIRHLIRICCLRVYNLLIYNRVSGYSSMIDLLRNLSYYHLVTIPCLRSKHFKKPSPDLSYYHLVTIPSLRSIHFKEPSPHPQVWLIELIKIIGLFCKRAVAASSGMTYRAH